jgi:hypothetical protein
VAWRYLAGYQLEVTMGKELNAISLVVVETRSGKIAKQGVYCFQVTVDDIPGELHVSEDVAFDLLGAWTLSTQQCLDILRRHHADLELCLKRKIALVGWPAFTGTHHINLHDIERANAIPRRGAKNAAFLLFDGSNDEPSPDHIHQQRLATD